MKTGLALVLALGLSSVAGFTAQVSLESFGEPFDGKNVEVIWSVTNQLPEAIEVFKVGPAKFSLEVLSNVVNLCNFKDPAAAWSVLQAAVQGKNAVYKEPFPGKPVMGKYLEVSPRLGYILFTDPAASSNPGMRVEGVPTDKETLELALKLLPKLEINGTELAHKAGSDELERFGVLGEIGSFDKQQKKHIKTPNLRGVILFRQLNGISLSGPGDCGGIRVEFGNNARMKELAISWRNLKPERKEPTADTDEIIRRIHQGKAVIRLSQDLPEIRPIKKLTIKQIRPYYFGNTGDEPQDYVIPYAMLSAIGDMGYTNVPVTLSCPVTR